MTGKPKRFEALFGKSARAVSTETAVVAICSEAVILH